LIRRRPHRSLIQCHPYRPLTQRRRCRPLLPRRSPRSNRHDRPPSRRRLMRLPWKLGPRRRHHFQSCSHHRLPGRGHRTRSIRAIPRPRQGRFASTALPRSGGRARSCLAVGYATFDKDDGSSSVSSSFVRHRHS
jgi:hypothetical protein